MHCSRDDPAREASWHFNPCFGWDYPPASYIAVILNSTNVYWTWRYAWLERVLPAQQRGMRSLRNAVLQVSIDELIFDPLFVGLFFFSTGAVERQHPWRDTLPHLREQYWPTLRGACLTSLAFTPIQFCSFRYLPVKCRVLVVNMCDVLWYAAVSFGRHNNRGGAVPATAS